MKSVYIHIPFCKNICNYCDFCKMYYNSNWVDNYLNALEKEVKLIYKQETLNTIYIGGGTPSCLNIKQLNKLFNITNNLKLNQNYEFTFECNIDDISESKLKVLKENKVNRISIGIQTFNNIHQEFINRKISYLDALEKINLVKKYFNNINVDLMYGFKNQTLQEVKEDLDLFLKLGVNHISTYSLIIEPHTKLYIEKFSNIDQEIDYEMYKLINKTLKENGYIHYEISNYSKENFKSQHNLVYWNNLNYYGFGLGASGYIDNIRYENTRNLNKYLNGDYVKEKTELTLKETMENEMILGLRKIDGVNIQEFYQKYNKNIDEVFEIEKLLQEKKLDIKDNQMLINEKYLYLSNDILINFIN